ncbi:type II toxin-antitoxin system VapC family toxin [Conexibacter sp. JD483]|uniref:type II toxin-antitoxin system VapC family toxin n=1 Tax=unclassified Conexibacter TaxID=2627773 RepID=UPI002720E73E|nr:MULTISPECIES: type II toxin-antitoxin system VapC family toxin [unclassified Conexibacter]MDO8189521.1 type II toxin-antitoxin system VapC family toxin [Conexibacter sp. CPCC 205706]MDO8198221.1 type II toxin-antitoxin system VapC family toxin [Conexibacter sp. CPCC 205762]MDR9372847.1 type II toxin-antitoxin system VapC family toxin [Conexibacter sp. JD483]
MTTAVDTNVLLDVLAEDSRFSSQSRAALSACGRRGPLIACGVVWAETTAAFADRCAGARALVRLGVRLVPLDATAATAAGQAWRSYRAEGGTRSRVIADFVVGAHAAVHADQLLTRDRGFRRLRFSGLTLVDPSC